MGDPTLHILVTLKQVPDTTDVRLDAATGVLKRDRAKGITNPEDKYALELAIGLKEKTGGKITVLSMGPETAKDSLKEALAMGADEAFLVSDPLAVGSDVMATSKILSAAIKKIGACDLVLTGRRSIDGSTGAVGPMLAELLQRPFVSAIRKLDLEGSEAKAEQLWEDGYQVVETTLPAVMAVSREGKSPRLATAMGIMKAAKKPMTVWSLADLELDAMVAGLAGSLTKVVRVSSPERKKRLQVWEGASPAAVSELNQKLAAKGLLS